MGLGPHGPTDTDRRDHCAPSPVARNGHTTRGRSQRPPRRGTSGTHWSSTRQQAGGGQPRGASGSQGSTAVGPAPWTGLAAPASSHGVQKRTPTLADKFSTAPLRHSALRLGCSAAYLRHRLFVSLIKPLLRSTCKRRAPRRSPPRGGRVSRNVAASTHLLHGKRH